MNLFTKLKETIVLTDTEKALVNYILNNHDQFTSLSIKELSKTAHVSTSTVYRLCSKLEINGLTELKLLVSRDIEKYKASNKNLDYNFPFTENQSPQMVVGNLEEIYHETITNAAQLVDAEELRLAVQDLYNAKAIDIFPSSGNTYVAENFKMQMQEIGYTVNLPVDMYEQYLIAGLSDASHTAIVISYANKYRETLNIVKHLKRNKAKIILISSPHPSAVTPYADHNLFISTNENPYDKISAFSIRLALQFMLDSIYSCFFKREYKKHLTFKNKEHIQMKYKGD